MELQSTADRRIEVISQSLETAEALTNVVAEFKAELELKSRHVREEIEAQLASALEGWRQLERQLASTVSNAELTLARSKPREMTLTLIAGGALGFCAGCLFRPW